MRLSNANPGDVLNGETSPVPNERDIARVSALRSASGEYLLNGNFVVSMFRKEMNMKGTLVEYSGSDNVIERINSTDSLQEDMDLLVSGHALVTPR